MTEALHAPPNIVLVLADNLGWGELGCYGGGVLRGAPTPRIDALAREGTRLTNFNVESDCVPTRGGLMTGRQAIRTGAFQSVSPGLPQGLTRWEVTLATLLSERGYATAHYGKWHLGDIEGRLPTDRGFDEWYGLPRTIDEAHFTSSVGFDQSVVDLPYLMEGEAGSPSRKVKVFDLETRRSIDGELIERSIRFMRAKVSEGRPFFAYVPITQLHFPSLPHPDFAGGTGYGDMADATAEMDHRVGQLLDEINELGIRDTTLFMFASDNGPEFRVPWRGSAGPWRGTYHTAMEGSLRAPCMMRWPGRIPANRVSDEIIHVSDVFTTLASIAGAEIPTDRPIDGLDQRAFLFGDSEQSVREGLVFYIKDQLRALKWRRWKLHLVWEPEVNQGAVKLESPYLNDLVRDPKEETDILTENTWVLGPMFEMLAAFEQSLLDYPPIPPGAADPYTPSVKSPPSLF